MRITYEEDLTEDSIIVETGSPVNDVPAMLRKLADEIEDESIPVLAAILTLATEDKDGDTNLDVYGWGEDAGTARDVYWYLSKARDILSQL